MMKKKKSKVRAIKTAKTGSEDIIQLILEDHKPLKKFIKVLKDAENDFADRMAAFEQFAPLLLAHAKPEAETLYVFMKDEDEMRVEGLEGDVEHALAEQMVEDAKATEDEDEWTAKTKVLAELVEHHIKEEEEEMLPDFRKNSNSEDRILLGQQYLQLKPDYEVNKSQAA